MRNLAGELISINALERLTVPYALMTPAGIHVYPLSYHSLEYMLVHDEKSLKRATADLIKYRYATEFNRYEVVLFDTYFTRGDFAYMGFLNLR